MTDLITLVDPRSATAEAYRELRTNLSFARPGEPLRSLMVTSPSDREEKAVTLANLAVVTAESGMRVVVVDCDLRLPRQHLLFGLGNERGVTTALVDHATDVGEMLQETPVDGLRVLTSGPVPPNPAELVGSRRMRELIGAVTQGSDLALFDAPPLVAVTDGAVLAPMLDGVLLVLAAGTSRRDHAARARTVLDNVGARLIGVALTDVEASSAAYGGYGVAAS